MDSSIDHKNTHKEGNNNSSSIMSNITLSQMKSNKIYINKGYAL